MNRLPKVLQNEIWEYVRGDRAYWMRQFYGVGWNLKSWSNEQLKRVKFAKDGFDVRITEWDNGPVLDWPKQFLVRIHQPESIHTVRVQQTRFGSYSYSSLAEAERAMNDAVYLARLGKFDNPTWQNWCSLEDCSELSVWSRYIAPMWSWFQNFAQKRSSSW
jgi:hypothetical protein